jgi:hypothetical protein
MKREVRHETTQDSADKGAGSGCHARLVRLGFSMHWRPLAE